MLDLDLVNSVGGATPPVPRNDLGSISAAFSGESFLPLWHHPSAQAFAGAPVGSLIWEDGDEAVILGVDYDSNLQIQVQRGDLVWRIPLDGTPAELLIKEA